MEDQTTPTSETGASATTSAGTVPGESAQVTAARRIAQEECDRIDDAERPFVPTRWLQSRRHVEPTSFTHAIALDSVDAERAVRRLGMDHDIYGDHLSDLLRTYGDGDAGKLAQVIRDVTLRRMAEAIDAEAGQR